jgi:Uma2 family endonuclease
MATKTRVSLAEFLAMPEAAPPLELIDGEVVQKAMPGPKHSKMVAELIYLLMSFLRERNDADVDTELRHVRRDEDWTFLPDISVTFRARRGKPAGAMGNDPVEVMPDFVIEVLSPDDQSGRTAQRISHYMDAGVRLLWLVDPDIERVSVWMPGALGRDVAPPAKLSAAPVLEGFEVDLEALFARLHV